MSMLVVPINLSGQRGAGRTRLSADKPCLAPGRSRARPRSPRQLWEDVMTGSIKHSFVICLGIACGAWTPILAVGAPEAAARTAGEELTFSLTADEPFNVPEASWTPRFEVLPGPELEKAALHLSFTSFTNFVQ